jgi:hypothetical protein
MCERFLWFQAWDTIVESFNSLQSGGIKTAMEITTKYKNLQQSRRKERNTEILETKPSKLKNPKRREWTTVTDNKRSHSPTDIETICFDDFGLSEKRTSVLENSFDDDFASETSSDPIEMHVDEPDHYIKNEIKTNKKIKMSPIRENLIDIKTEGLQLDNDLKRLDIEHRKLDIEYKKLLIRKVQKELDDY